MAVSQLLRLRRRLGPELEFLDCQPDVLAYRRGEHIIVLNLGDDAQLAPRCGEVVLATYPQSLDQTSLRTAA